MIDLPIHIIYSKRESNNIIPITAFLSEENAKLQISEWSKSSNDEYGILKLDLRLTKNELSNLISK